MTQELKNSGKLGERGTLLCLVFLKTVLLD